MTGDGANSPYTLALAETLVESGLKVEDVFKRVRVRVLAETGERQTPWESSSLRGDFYFVPAKVVDEDPVPVADGVKEDAEERLKDDGSRVIALRMEAEREFWVEIKDSDDPADFDDYLTQYPGGLYENLARRRRDKLLVAADDAAFARADSAGTSSAYAEYLDSYPSGRSVREARERLQFADLLGRKFSADAVDESGWTDLHYAAAMDLPRVAAELLETGMNVDVRLADDGRAFGGRLKASLRALEYDVDGWNGEANGETPLMVAARQDARSAAKLLIERGADVNAKRGYGETSLFWAARWNALEVARMLIARGADPDAEAHDVSRLWFSSSGLTPLHWAAKANSREVAELLIDHGADIEAKEPVGWTTLHLAADVDAVEVAELLINRGADLDAKDSDGATPLMHARSWGDREFARLLIEHGAEVTLSYAAVANDRELAQELIERGADPNEKDGTSGTRPLHHAAESGALEVAEFLIDHGAGIDAQDDDGSTPLMNAAAWNHHDIAELLMARGALVDACCGHAGTALHQAANMGRPTMAKLLLDRGASADATDDDEDTPLHSAAWRGHAEVAEVLIDHGVNVNARNNAGRTPLDIARKGDDGEHGEMVELLRRHGGICAKTC